MLDAVERLAVQRIGFVRRLETGELRLYIEGMYASVSFIGDALVVFGVRVVGQ